MFSKGFDPEVLYKNIHLLLSHKTQMTNPLVCSRQHVKPAGGKKVDIDSTATFMDEQGQVLSSLDLSFIISKISQLYEIISGASSSSRALARIY